MAQPLLKDLDDLVNKNIISADTAKQIELYYESKKDHSSNRFTTVLAILGALLLSSGIVLVIAHNWDMLSRTVRTIIAFIPLAAGQALCFYALLKKKDNRGWVESASVFLFFAVAICISLIAQIYQVSGSMSSFLLTWIIATLALVYIMPSSMVSLLIIALATCHAAMTGYSTSGIPYEYVCIMLLLLPHYYGFVRRRYTGNFFHLHNWFAALSFPIVLGAFIWSGYDYFEWVFIAYIALAGVYYLWGKTSIMNKQRLIGNPFRLLGTPSIIAIFIAWTFNTLWQEIKYSGNSGSTLFSYPFSYIVIALLLAGGYLLIRDAIRSKSIDIVGLSPLLFTAGILLLPRYIFAGQLLFNVWVLAIGIFFIRKGAAKDHLGILNFGLVVIALLAIFRFFDDQIPFILRGLIFIATGAGFFVSNSLIIKKRKALAQKPLP